MKKLLLIALTVFFSLASYGQDRVDTALAQLSYKSKEIKKALYWEKNNKGKWKSRKNTKLIYYGEGVRCDNFFNLFIGEHKAHKYLFLDYIEYYWLYPNIQKQWMVRRSVMAANLTAEDYDSMQNLEVGKTLTIIPKFYYELPRSHREYSFPFLLEMTETLRSSTERMYNSYLRTDGEARANSYLLSEYPPIFLITLKRVKTSDGTDAVRFRVYPGGLSELIDSHYFEISYKTYQNLFTPDKTTMFK